MWVGGKRGARVMYVRPKQHCSSNLLPTSTVPHTPVAPAPHTASRSMLVLGHNTRGTRRCMLTTYCFIPQPVTPKVGCCRVGHSRRVERQNLVRTRPPRAAKMLVASAERLCVRYGAVLLHGVVSALTCWGTPTGSTTPTSTQHALTTSYHSVASTAAGSEVYAVTV